MIQSWLLAFFCQRGIGSGRDVGIKGASQEKRSRQKGPPQSVLLQTRKMRLSRAGKELPEVTEGF